MRRRDIFHKIALAAGIAALMFIIVSAHMGCSGRVPSAERLWPPASPTEPPHRGESIEDHVNNATRFPDAVKTPDTWAPGPKLE